jgi:hypothetical protein
MRLILKNSFAVTLLQTNAVHYSSNTKPASRLALTSVQDPFIHLAYASQKALKERGIDSMLDEARDSNRENDAEHMKRTCK